MPLEQQCREFLTAKARSKAVSACKLKQTAGQTEAVEQVYEMIYRTTSPGRSYRPLLYPSICWNADLAPKQKKEANPRQICQPCIECTLAAL